MWRFAVDTGGTFTDLTVEEDDGTFRMFKSPTTPGDPIDGVINVLGVAAKHYRLDVRSLLATGDTFIHGTTHSINAVITGRAAKTAFLTTAGHPDILYLREGGRADVFNHTIRFPAPYVPRRLTFEIDERIDRRGTVLKSIDVNQVKEVLQHLRELEVEAIGVCLLWSILNPEHEEVVASLLREHLPGVPYTLSHLLNPTPREYRRASSTVIDASLKPLMQRYLNALQTRLNDAGFSGRVLVLTSQAGMVDAAELATTPIHSLNSGPSVAPLAGRYYGQAEGYEDVIVADTGGTTYDVSLVRGGVIPTTREMWLGQPNVGHLTGFPSVDVRSVGAGGGSIARIDEGGLLLVGPKSAGAVPGPACYGKGGIEPTLTDACVALGYIDPHFFLGGGITLDRQLAEKAIKVWIADPLGISVADAALAIVDVATENMVQAIADITVNQGVDPARSVLIGGGGAAGLNSVLIARRLNCERLIIPEVGAALSAAGALMSDLAAEFHATAFTSIEAFDHESVNKALARLEQRCRTFAQAAQGQTDETSVEFFVEARYRGEVYEIETPLPSNRVVDQQSIDAIIRAFHETHKRIYAVSDLKSPVEFVTWTAKVKCVLHQRKTDRPMAQHLSDSAVGTRAATFRNEGTIKVPVFRLETLAVTKQHRGPALVESAFTTVVIDHGAEFWKQPNGSLVITTH